MRLHIGTRLINLVKVGVFNPSHATVKQMCWIQITVINQPNPSEALRLGTSLLDYLLNTCHWPPSWAFFLPLITVWNCSYVLIRAIHLFGFGQGGSLAAELALRYPQTLGSCVIVNGPLLSLPTRNKKSQTPLLSCRRRDENVKKAWLDKGFEAVQEIVWSSPGNMRKFVCLLCRFSRSDLTTWW